MHGVQMDNALMAQQRVGHFWPRPQIKPMQSAQQAIELVERQVVELAKITRFEKKTTSTKGEGRSNPVSWWERTKTCKAMAAMVKKRIQRENETTHGFVVVGSEDDMLSDELNMKSINWIAQKIIT